MRLKRIVEYRNVILSEDWNLVALKPKIEIVKLVRILTLLSLMSN